MTIAGLIERSKTFWSGLLDRLRARFETIPKDVFAVGILVLCCSTTFWLGMLVERDLGERDAFTIQEVPFENLSAAVVQGVTPAPMTLPTESGEVVASKNGTKYYYSWCSGISRISPANLVKFTSATAAETKGYTRSSTCKAP